MRVQALHQRRDRAFPTLTFANPEWNILLELFVQASLGREICVTSLCIASGVPVSSALRCINDMLEKGLLAKTKDEDDRRRLLISMSDRALDHMQAVLSTS